METEPVWSCYLCGLPADRGPYVLRLEHQPTSVVVGEPRAAQRATSREMMVCRLCDTSPALFEQLTGKLSDMNRNRPTYPTRGVQYAVDTYVEQAQFRAQMLELARRFVDHTVRYDVDGAKAQVDMLLRDLLDRRAFRQAWADIDEVDRVEIRETWQRLLCEGE